MKEYKKDFVLFFNTINKLNIRKSSILLVLVSLPIDPFNDVASSVDLLSGDRN